MSAIWQTKLDYENENLYRNNPLGGSMAARFQQTSAIRATFLTLYSAKANKILFDMFSPS